MSTPKYWMATEELDNDQEFMAKASKEFSQPLPTPSELKTEKALNIETNRRDFLKVMGFGMTAATLAACTRGPVKKAIPYVEKPDDLVPGVANWYSSTTPSGNPILVKTREGRPIKLEGNPDARVTGGGLSAADHASVLDLYDSERTRAPYKGGNASDWSDVDSEIRQKLNSIKENGGSVRVVTDSVMSPSTRQLIGEFVGEFADGEHVSFDALSASAIREAHELGFGQAMLPRYRFDLAEVIISFSADFLGTWIAPVTFASQYVVKRDPDKKMSRHLQFESVLTTTGAKADMRFPIKPSQEGAALLNLYNKVAGQLGSPQIPGVIKFNVAGNGLDKAASELIAAGSKGLLVCGTNDVAMQALVAGINQMIGAYGTTLDITNPAYYKQGDDAAMANVVRQMGAGEIDAVIFYGANPVYDSPFAKAIEDNISKVGLSISMASKADETAKLCQYICPDSNYLESWSDSQQNGQQYSIVQPTIYPIFNTRQGQDSLLSWMGSSTAWGDYLKAYWNDNLYTGEGTFTNFWNQSLRSGVVETAGNTVTPTYQMDGSALASMATSLRPQTGAEGSFELVLYPTTQMMDGKQANNPWLQELPDSITKVCWDQVLTVPFSNANELGLKNNDIVEVSVNGVTVSLPVVVQAGQALGTLGVQLGYGRTEAGKVAEAGNGETISGRKVGGVNAFGMASLNNNAVKYSAPGATIAKTSVKYELAFTQTYNYLYDIEKGERFGNDYDRSEAIVETTTSYEYNNGAYKDGRVAERNELKQHLVTLWDSYFEDPETSRNIHWKMAIDLNKCTGCNACIVSCHAENNVPVVGKAESRNRRNMHWLRMDRYYSGDFDNPDVAFQPMLCQHCDNAPCETVCPVLATIHSNEGLNQMTYNRCVGTRYCANNCPYKVRRFNWFNYTNDEKVTDINPSQSTLGKLVLNPDVTVRFRGVMEKCSFCVQRLQDAKLKAKINANDTFAKPKDGMVQTACQQSCPTGAIVFGDFNDPNSEVSRLFREDRSYSALEEVKTIPSIKYQAIVKNRDKAETEQKAAELAAVKEYKKA
ncbi:MAG: TAT-variant-translocated molybdopterin oxidoreductase [Bacteroidia bacterium]